MVRDGGRELATQAAFAGAIKHSRLLGDFMDITMREQRVLFSKKLETRMWNEYIAGCRGRDPDMPHWSDTTVAKLRSVVFSMLAEADYLKDTRSLQLQNVFVDAQLAVPDRRSVGRDAGLQLLKPVTCAICHPYGAWQWHGTSVSLELRRSKGPEERPQILNQQLGLLDCRKMTTRVEH